MWYGKNITKIGQETWLPIWVHTAIRFVFDDNAIQLIRHFPDFATNRALVQVKAAPDEKEYKNVTIEEASYRVSEKLSKYVPVLIVWLYSDGKTFWGNWVNEIHPHNPVTPREDTFGSHTPYLLVNKEELHKLSDFLEDL